MMFNNYDTPTKSVNFSRYWKYKVEKHKIAGEQLLQKRKSTGRVSRSLNVK